MLTPAQRRQFDDLLDAIIAELPEKYHALLEEIPVVVEDRPSAQLLQELKIDGVVSVLCGLHSGIPLTNRSVEHSGAIPDQIMLFREPIMQMAGTPVRLRRGGGRRFGAARERAKQSAREALKSEIRITLLHEMGHHFGLDEDELAELGYG